MSTTARTSMKTKTLTLLELSQSVNDFRSSLPTVSSYQYHLAPNAPQGFTRHLYLHPLTINLNQKPVLPKIARLESISPTSISDFESTPPQQQLTFDRNRDSLSTKNKLSHQGLAVLSSSYPLTARTNPKSEIRHTRDKVLFHTDDDTNSDFDPNTTSVSLPPMHSSSSTVTRGTLASTHTKCNRPTRLIPRRHTFTKHNRLEKINYWYPLESPSERPVPVNPPTTPLPSISDMDIENDESDQEYINYNAIQRIQIYKRNPGKNSIINDDHDYDYYIYNK